MRRFLLVIVPALAAMFASSCSIQSGGGTNVKISAEYHTSGATYTLLYSTLGYEANATKRVLIRQNDPQAQISEGLAFEWRLVDAGGKQVAASHASYIGTAWSIPIWEADFTSVVKPGTYRMVVDSPGVKLATDPFPVDSFLMFKTAYNAVALDNAEARSAPIELDNGFFDSNTRSGYVSSDADFLVGLVQSYTRRRSALTQDQKSRTLDAINRALDYLLLLSDPGTGKFQSQASGRPYLNDDPPATAAGLRALAAYAAAFQQEDADRAQRAYRRARLAEEWLNQNAPALYTPALQADVSYDLYRYSNDSSTLARATAAVRTLTGNYDLRSMDRASGNGLPDFEAMYRMWHDLTVNPDRGYWQDAAKKVAAQYHEMLDKNPFHIIPTGVTSADDGTSASEQWDDVGIVPPPGEGVSAVIGNDWFIARAIDAIYISEIAGDAELEKVATAELQWITGINPGIPIDRVGFTGGGSGVEAASFLTGLPGRSVKPWSTWDWPRPKPFATIVNGFRRAFSFEDSDAAGETSLGHDGLWLYATSLYEDYVNPGKRPLPGSAASSDAQSPAGVRVASARAADSGGVLQFVVSVDGPDAKPLPGVDVTISWYGAPLSTTAAEDAVHVSNCTTDAAGSCTATLIAAALAVKRPITVAVTNLEHPLYAYDISADDPSKIAAIP